MPTIKDNDKWGRVFKRYLALSKEDKERVHLKYANNCKCNPDLPYEDSLEHALNCGGFLLSSEGGAQEYEDIQAGEAIWKTLTKS